MLPALVPSTFLRALTPPPRRRKFGATWAPLLHPDAIVDLTLLPRVLFAAR